MDQIAESSSSTIDRDIACSQCSYNLRGLDAGRKCPECGGLIADSIREAREILAVGSLQRIVLSIRLLLTAFALGLAGATIALWDLPNSSGLIAMSGFVLAALSWLIVGAAIWIIVRALWRKGGLVGGTLWVTLVACTAASLLSPIAAWSVGSYGTSPEFLRLALRDGLPIGAFIATGALFEILARVCSAIDWRPGRRWARVVGIATVAASALMHSLLWWELLNSNTFLFMIVAPPPVIGLSSTIVVIFRNLVVRQYGDVHKLYPWAPIPLTTIAMVVFLFVFEAKLRAVIVSRLKRSEQ